MALQEMFSTPSILRLPGWKGLHPTAVKDDCTFDPHSGGAATPICPELSAVASFEKQFVVPGRCLATSRKA